METALSIALRAMLRDCDNAEACAEGRLSVFDSGTWARVYRWLRHEFDGLPHAKCSRQLSLPNRADSEVTPQSSE